MNRNKLLQILSLKQKVGNADISNACLCGLDSATIFGMRKLTFLLLKSFSTMTILLATIAATITFAGCATTPYPPPPRPIEHWVDRKNATDEGRVEVTDAQYSILSPRTARISGRLFCRQKIETYSEEVNSGRKRNRSARWQAVSSSQARLKSILGSSTVSVSHEGRFESHLSIPESHNRFFRDPGNLPRNMMLSKDLLTVDVLPISSNLDFPSVNLTRVPVFIAEKRIVQQPTFDLEKAVRTVEAHVCSKVVLKFENMRSRLPENPLVAVIGISAPTEKDLVRTCMDLGYTNSQAARIIGQLDFLRPNQKLSDSGQMMVFKGIRKGVYAIEARNAGAHFTRIELVIEDSPTIEKTVLLSPDRGQMIFENSIEGGAVSQ